MNFGYPLSIIFATTGAQLQQFHILLQVAPPLTPSSCSFQLGSNADELLEAQARAETFFSPQLLIKTELEHFEHCVRIYRKHPVKLNDP